MSPSLLIGKDLGKHFNFQQAGFAEQKFSKNQRIFSL